MRERVIIWGAGTIGKLAVYYYRDKCEILGIVDNNSDLWGKSQFEIPIYSPSYINEVDDVKIILAIRRNKEIVQRQLEKEFGISRCISFDIIEEVAERYLEGNSNISDEIIIEYEGGLGNQMFQYAFAEYFHKKGYKVTADISTYYHIGRREFILSKVFNKINISPANMSLKWKYKKDNIVIREKSIYDTFCKEIDLTLFNYQFGYFEGYWQSYKFANEIEKDLRKEFVFPIDKENKLEEISCQIQNQCAISVHIRRGDYLEKKAHEIMGGICTINYYQKAIRYIQENIPDACFYFFSEDIEWCKKIFNNIKAFFVEKDMFEFYQDWYDMYLMSCCKHNIIANSTFSWWGAWLNNYENKIVIAPKKWVNICDVVDICPCDWVRI